MMLNAICRVGLASFKAPTQNVLCRIGNPVVGSLKTQWSSQIVRPFRTNNTMLNEGRRESQFIRRAKDRMGIKDRALGPTSGAPFQIGQGVVAGAAVFGLGALCYYGAGMNGQVGASTADRSILWQEYVRQRVRDTYAYFGGSLIFTAGAAAAAFRSPALMNLMMRNSWLVMGASMAAMIGSGMVVRGMPYKEGFGAKQVGWMVHSGVVGVVLAPLCMLGGPLLLRAAVMTAGIVGGLSAIAVCAPSEQFLNMGAPLGIGLGVVFASSLGSMFVPMTSALGAGLYSIALYGGLVLFSGFLLYDTQKIVKYAENLPPNSMAKYDPINASMGIYMDTINIFVRIAQIYAMGGNRRK